MIIEVIFSTVGEDGCPNFAPMGVTWGEEELIVRPFRDTHTYRNLMATGCGVANVTDDVLLFAQSALSDPVPPHFAAGQIGSVVLRDVCYWREVVVTEVGGSATRAEILCQVVGQGWRRPFLGFSRAKGAVIEAAILATRLHLHDEGEVEAAFRSYQEIVDKTGGEQEKEAMRYLRDYVRRWAVACAH